jgi:hypothetical protein
VSAPKVSNAKWLSACLALLFHDTEVRCRVLVAGWERDNSLGAELRCDGWKKTFRIPISMLDEEDVFGVARCLALQSGGQILVKDSSLQMIESEGLLH